MVRTEISNNGSDVEFKSFFKNRFSIKRLYKIFTIIAP